ncbi:hypothetical protein HDU76_002261, partial [Blyttiomyces sp. JEL0837]
MRGGDKPKDKLSRPTGKDDEQQQQQRKKKKKKSRKDSNGSSKSERTGKSPKRSGSTVPPGISNANSTESKPESPKPPVSRACSPSIKLAQQTFNGSPKTISHPFSDPIPLDEHAFED